MNPKLFKRILKCERRKENIKRFLGIKQKGKSFEEQILHFKREKAIKEQIVYTAICNLVEIIKTYFEQQIEKQSAKRQ